MEDPDLLPHRELFRRRSYWGLLVLPILFFGLLHALLASRSHPLAHSVPLIGFLAGAAYGFSLTQWLRRRWGRRTPPRKES